MTENKKVLDDRFMEGISGGTETPQTFAFAVGDRVTLKYYDQIGIITEAYYYQFQTHFWNMYAVHWLKDNYNEEHDSRDVLEEKLKRA